MVATTRLEEHRAPSGLEELLTCSWAGIFDGERHDLVPDGCVDLVHRADGSLVVCGPESRGWSFRVPAGSCSAGVRLRPGVAPLLLDISGAELAERQIVLEAVSPDVFGRRLRARLGSVDDVEHRRELLLQAIVDRLADLDVERPPDVARALAELDRPVAVVASELGWSRRHLQRLAIHSVGLDPTTHRRVLRLDRAVRRLRRRPFEPVASVAAACGYCDQSHLSREAVAIAGSSPGRLRRPRSAGGTGTDAVPVDDGAPPPLSPQYKSRASDRRYGRPGN